MPAPDKTTPTTKISDLGRALKRARLLRRLPMMLIAKQVGISIPTLRRIENGDPNVRIASYFDVMHALGVLQDFAAFTDTRDTELSDQQIPKRGRTP